jgi:hypothetical protein
VHAQPFRGFLDGHAVVGGRDHLKRGQAAREGLRAGR